MINKVYLFNPENDIALADGRSTFTPSSQPKLLANNGSLLPFWWAEENDAVLIPPSNQSAIKEFKERYGLKGKIFDSLRDSDYQPSPWGWSKYTRRLYAKAGLLESNLPSEQDIDVLRELSHRRLTVKIHELIETEKDCQPIEAKSITEAMNAIERWNNDAVVKQPWSSSGRGVFFTKYLSSEKLSIYINGFIRRQGSAMIEKRHEKIKDFALLFTSDTTGIRYVGLSAFQTSPTGEYLGNLIETDQKLQSFIGHDLAEIRDRIKNALSIALNSKYQGPIGVDMMIERWANGEERIVPCVEMNLRMTMGFLAHKIAENHKDFRGRILHLTIESPSADDIDLSPLPESKYHYLLSKKEDISH